MPLDKDTLSLEFATDTVIEPYNPADSLHEKLRAVAQQKKAVNTVIQRRKRYLQRLDHMLTARIDSLLKDYETETLLRARTSTPRFSWLSAMIGMFNSLEDTKLHTNTHFHYPNSHYHNWKFHF